MDTNCPARKASPVGRAHIEPELDDPGAMGARPVSSAVKGPACVVIIARPGDLSGSVRAMKKHMTAAFFLAGLAMALASVACSKKTDLNAPGPRSGLAAGRRRTAARCAAPRGSRRPPPPHRPRMPIPARPSRGRIPVEPAIAKFKPKGVLYLVARRLSDNPTARGTLVAVKKFENATYPLSFTLGAADMPFQNGAFDGELSLSARIDQDGDPITRQKGDVFGNLAQGAGRIARREAPHQRGPETGRVAGRLGTDDRRWAVPPGHP